MATPKAPAFSEAVDDYLKAILALGGAENRPVGCNALAERLGVRPASITGMLRKLSAQRPPLVEYRKSHGARLSPSGQRRAWELVRHHRLLELFLHNVLGYGWDEVHPEAERLEHFISERFEDRVAAILGNPEIDPHGHVIPAKRAKGTFPAGIPLSEWDQEAPARISSVSDQQAAALRAIERRGLRPGVAVVIDGAGSSREIRLRIIDGEGRSGPPIRLKRAWASCIAVVAAPAPGA